MAVRKIFTWAYMLRIDMIHLGFDSINRYAIGLGENDKYSNVKPVISMITYARRHTDISSMRLNMRSDKKAASERWNDLYKQLCELNGYN